MEGVGGEERGRRERKRDEGGGREEIINVDQYCQYWMTEK